MDAGFNIGNLLDRPDEDDAHNEDRWGRVADVESGNEASDVSSLIDRLKSLRKVSKAESLVFQSVVVAALQTMFRVRERQHQALKRAISLAQGHKLGRMIQTTEDTIGALSGLLSAQGDRMLNMCSPSVPLQSEPSWWYALTETIEALEEGTERVAAIVSGQPKAGPARTLSSLIVRILRRQHHALLLEADQWIS